MAAILIGGSLSYVVLITGCSSSLPHMVDVITGRSTKTGPGQYTWKQGFEQRKDEHTAGSKECQRSEYADQYLIPAHGNTSGKSLASLQGRDFTD